MRAGVDLRAETGEAEVVMEERRRRRRGLSGAEVGDANEVMMAGSALGPAG